MGNTVCSNQSSINSQFITMQAKILYKFNDPLNKTRRQTLRQDQTKAEQVLWEELRNRRMGYKWRRQCGIGSFIVDFYCAELALVIELDGPIHDEQKEYDAFRDSELAKRNLKIIRYKNDEVLFDRERVMREIKSLCEQRKSAHS